MMRFFLAVSIALLQLPRKKLYHLTLQNIRNVPDQSNYIQVYTLQYLCIVNKYQASIWYKMFFSDKSSLQELSIYLFKKTWIEKSFFLGKKEMHILIFHSFLVGWIDGLLARRKKGVMYVCTYVLCSWVRVYSSAVIHFGGLKVQIDPTTCTAMTLSDRGNKINE